MNVRAHWGGQASPSGARCGGTKGLSDRAVDFAADGLGQVDVRGRLLGRRRRLVDAGFCRGLGMYRAIATLSHGRPRFLYSHIIHHIVTDIGGVGQPTEAGAFPRTGRSVRAYRWEYQRNPLVSVMVGRGGPPGFWSRSTLKSQRPNHAGSLMSW